MDENVDEDILHAESEESMEEDKFRLYASVAFIAVVLVVGVPMWWKTTEVYRVDLPSTNILNLSNEPIRAAVKIGIFTFDPQRSELLIKELSEQFNDNGRDNFIINFVQVVGDEHAKTFKTPTALEIHLLKSHPINEGEIMFIEWPKLDDEILMTTERSALFRSDTSSTKIKLAINLLVLQVHRVQQLLTKNQRLAYKSEAPQSEYDVVISVLNPNPEIMDVKWNVQMAVDTYIKPFLSEVNHLSNYTIKTQWKFQVPFEADLKQIRDGSKLGRHYALAESSFPHIITSIEKYLGVDVADKKAIHLVVYVPPCTIAPIHIYDASNKKATENGVDSFISPKWGGIIIANPSEETCMNFNVNLQPVSQYLQTNDIMQIMLHHLQKLLDISIELKMDGIKVVGLEQIAPRKWEYEAYLRRSCIMHLATATNTLQSLVNLLQNISYIVINDEVGAAINEAYKDIQLAKLSLENGDFHNASQVAGRAFTASEQAFFDASLLAQLYFPDEQKYAIYIPLFLPIMVPVLTSFSMIRKLWKKVRSVRKLKKQ